MMLADVHELGLLGAMTTMLMIAVVNAGLLGGLIGEGWRQKNSVWPGPMVGGWVMVSIGAMGVPAWNLFVGHFRDSMLAVATKAARGASSLGDLLTDDTVDRFLNNPFGLESMASWLLAVIGVGACVLSATKWLKRDDVYPGYGPRYRTAIEQNEEYVQEVEQRRKNLRNSYKQYIGLIRDERLKVENKKGNHRLITDTAREIVRQFPMQLRQYQDHLDFIIGAYRDGNKKARTTPSPAFFDERLLIDQEMLEAPEWNDIRPSDYDEDWDGFHQAEEAIRQAYLDARAGYPTLEDWIASKDGERVE